MSSCLGYVPLIRNMRPKSPVLAVRRIGRRVALAVFERMMSGVFQKLRVKPSVSTGSKTPRPPGFRPLCVLCVCAV